MLIYLISFLEALSGGLVGINTALYFKYSLNLSEVSSATIFSAFGILSSVLILLLGRSVDTYGIKRTMAFGAITLVLGRVGLYFTHSLNLAISLLVIMAIGSAVKGSSVLVYLRQQGKSFKLDYVIFNLAYCISGFLFDLNNKNYNMVFLIAGLITLFNLFVIIKLPSIKSPDETIKQKSILSYDPKTLKTVILYNSIMLPVSGIFTFMGTFIPKWALTAIGPDAPVGKLYGSLNPAIILITVPLFALLARKVKLDPYKAAIYGTSISALSLFGIYTTTNWLYSAIIVIATFTVGEAIWSPANMEVGTKLCPVGQEGRYLTISLIPRTLMGFFMSWLIAFNFTHYIYVNKPNFSMPFMFISLFSLLTPLGLIIFKDRLSTKI